VLISKRLESELSVDVDRGRVQEEEYVEWMAAVKMACRGRTMADTTGYQAELHALRSLLRLHHSCPSPSPSSPPLSASSTADADKSVAVRLHDLVASRHLNRLRHKQVRSTSPSMIWRHTSIFDCCVVYYILCSRCVYETTLLTPCFCSPMHHLVQRGLAWAGPQPTQAPPRCSTKSNSPPVNGQCTNRRIAV